MGVGIGAEFRAAFRRHPAGVAIITADHGGRPVGLTATSVASVAVEPPMLMFSLSASSSATPALAGADSVVVHLPAAGQVELAKRFAASGVDRFADPASWRRLATGEPVLVGVGCWLRTRTAHRLDVANAVVVLAEVVEVRMAAETGPPLLYQDRTWLSLDAAAVLP